MSAIAELTFLDFFFFFAVSLTKIVYNRKHNLGLEI